MKNDFWSVVSWTTALSTVYCPHLQFTEWKNDKYSRELRLMCKGQFLSLSLSPVAHNKYPMYFFGCIWFDEGNHEKK